MIASVSFVCSRSVLCAVHIFILALAVEVTYDDVTEGKSPVAAFDGATNVLISTQENTNGEEDRLHFDLYLSQPLVTWPMRHV